MRRDNRLPCAVSIAGSDSGAGAGVQADLKAMAAQGIYGLTVIAAVTAQNTLGVDRFEVLSAEMVEAQIDSVFTDFPVAAVKTGMLGNGEVVEAVVSRLKRYGAPNVVVDPVMVAKGGDLLLEKDTQLVMQKELFPLAAVVTPNIPEAEVLSGVKIEGVGQMREAAKVLYESGPAYVLIKGGHLPGGRLLTDLLFDGERFFFYQARRIYSKDTHGTGCTYASAIAAWLAWGLPVPFAVLKARCYLQSIIPMSPGLGGGNGPMDHFACWRRKV
ncbi:MAG: bifunctional hydroxymethylpyrimidine kinase/phosphomethylpyrimidine kinase [Dethiobacteria bacterium]